jgi:hypothetical protein
MRPSLLTFALTVPLAALPILAPSAAQATVVKALSLEEKTHVAPLVIHALVERVESAWELPGASANTFITLRVLESLRGRADRDARIVMRQGGGRIGDFNQLAAGQSAYEPGEEVVVFLEPNGSEYVEIGIGIAKYSIQWNGREKIVSHRPEVALARIGEDGRILSIRPAEPTPPEPLTTFLKRVRTYAKAVSKKLETFYPQSR